MAKWNIGKKNGMWSGGRSVASNGYILIRVGRGHHLADVRGYAYEHRLVAEEKLGRKLKPGEVIHHLNKTKSDNRPENIEVEKSRRHHAFDHRKNGSKRKAPEDLNVLVICKCGCGGTFNKFDSCGRPRTYITGHNGKGKWHAPHKKSYS